MEKLIYIHVLRLGESLYESDDVDSGYRDATNDCNLTDIFWVRCGGDGCKEIRCLDTRNARDGWKTCFALPFAFSGGRSAVVDGRWLYLFAGNRHDGFRNPDPWGFALNVVDSNKGEVEVRKIIKPHLSRFYPIASASLSPGWVSSDDNSNHNSVPRIASLTKPPPPLSLVSLSLPLSPLQFLATMAHLTTCK
ncbi:hypothetical protein GH714_023544 [Hevea brasiliensis]|uniref:Uncharacterized protein n=1 Tax=Hevea brasiliensis TaxID=3981 RepID=A0A6A6LD88_HEVBR|nr:hypothetical protein GH714_023544 [Hevea brasiliensis]